MAYSLIWTNSLILINTFKNKLAHRCLDNRGPTVAINIEKALLLLLWPFQPLKSKFVAKNHVPKRTVFVLTQKLLMMYRISQLDCCLQAYCVNCLKHFPFIWLPYVMYSATIHECLCIIHERIQFIHNTNTHT